MVASKLSFEFLTLHRYLLSVVDFQILINVHSARGTEAIGQRFCRYVGPVCHGMKEKKGFEYGCRAIFGRSIGLSKILMLQAKVRSHIRVYRRRRLSFSASQLIGLIPVRFLESNDRVFCDRSRYND